MNYILIILISIGISTASTWQAINSNTVAKSNFTIKASNIDITTVEFNIEGFHLIPVSTTEGEMNIARLSEGASLLEVGAPDLHKYSRSIIIPDDKKMNIKVLSSNYKDYQNILIAPSKGNLSRTINPNDIPFEFGAVYEKDSFYPGSLAQLGTPYILRDLRGQAVEFYPFQYNPVQKVLRVFTEIKVEVFENGIGNTNFNVI